MSIKIKEAKIWKEKYPFWQINGWVDNSLKMKELKKVRLAGLEPATQGLGIPCSILTELQAHLETVYLVNIVYLVYFVFLIKDP